MTTPIEIGFAIGGDPGAALARLPGAAATTTHDLWFGAPARDATDPLALAAGGIAIRLRGGPADDLVVDLLPCPPARLVGRWAAPFVDGDLEYRVEGAWRGSRRELAASAVSHRPAGAIRAAVAAGGDVTELLSPAQRRFLVTCTPPGATVDRLRAVGPLACARLTGIRLAGCEIGAERWTGAGCDLLELATRVTPMPGEPAWALHSRARGVQRRCEEALRERGLAPGTVTDRTAHVLRALLVRDG
ncbi:hypothetical protein ACFYTF_23685 [Nocardia thailandica]|uniref:Uncharacterized protein n=1 Tax=Nocardia thailandica TaxID=257275 RepID=A0ABW6PTU2_9NOCA